MKSLNLQVTTFCEFSVKLVQFLKSAPKVTKLEKNTQSYQTLKTYFDQNKAPLFATQKYSRLKHANF